jgi:sulfite reductase alpha subunit-like flavoprotein
MKHHENENQVRGGCPADWVWVVPPLSSHLTPVFHLEMLNYTLKPSYEYQDPPWRSHVWKQKSVSSNDERNKRTRRRVTFSDIARAVKFSAKLMGKALAKRVKCTILYATETGKSERFAKSLAEIFKHSFNAKCLNMRDYDAVDLEHENLVIIVTSTFGNGDPPENGEVFFLACLLCLFFNFYPKFINFNSFKIGI